MYSGVSQPRVSPRIQFESVRGRALDEPAKLTGTIRVKKRIYDHVTNRSVESFRLTTTTHSRVYYDRLTIKSDIPCTTKHSRAYCQHLLVKKYYTGCYKKTIWQSDET